ncbi:MAG: DUF2020 domain-containing protein [Corynebacterium sp.]|nr:DUF2020 domain-containing protein [Corynebacterium sp.]
MLADALPIPALPALTRGTGEACPYLDGQWLADTNGQRLVDQSVDHNFMTPACVFFSYTEEPQAIVMVRHLPTEEDAYAVVDRAAPIDVTSPAETTGSPAELGGWSGGRGVLQPGTYSDPEFIAGMYPGTTFPGSVYAVSKENTAVVVWTNQEQTVKAEAIAHEAISNLGL